MLRLIALLLALATPVAANQPNAWAPHFEARLGAIFAHAATAGVGHVVVLGDSNTEGFWWNMIGNCRVVNAGFGGARIADIAGKAEWVASTTAPAVVHIMAGTNNLYLKDGDAERSTEAADLLRTIEPFKAKGAKVVLWEIPPTSREFAPVSERERVNAIIRQVAKDSGALLESAWAASLANVDGAAAAGTVFIDGVHITAAGQSKRFARIEEINRSLGVKCP